MLPTGFATVRLSIGNAARSGRLWAGLAVLAAVLRAALAPHTPEIVPLDTGDNLLIVLVRDWNGTIPKGFLDSPGTALAPARDWNNAVHFGDRNPEPGAQSFVEILQEQGIAVDAESQQAREWAGVGTTPTPVGASPHDTIQRCAFFVDDDWHLPDIPEGWGIVQIPANIPDTTRWAPVRILPPSKGIATRGNQPFWRPWSPSTRNTGFIAASDLPATMAQMLGVESMVGNGRAVAMANENSGNLLKQWRQWQVQAAGFPGRWFVPVLAGILVLILVKHPKLSLGSAILAGIATLVWEPVVASSILARMAPIALENPRIASLLAMAPYGLALMAGISVAFARGSVLGLVAFLPAAIPFAHLVDALLGYPSQTASPLGYGPAEAARFHGIGNETAGLWLGAIAWLGWHDRRTAMGHALAAAIAIGSPGWGANFGCGIAALGGGLAFAAMEIPVRYRKCLVPITCIAAILATGGILWRDASRPATQQSHFGALAAKVVAGDFDELDRFIRRKVAMNVHLVVASKWTWLLGVSAFALGRAMRNRQLSVVGIVGPTIALLANDSGVVAAGMACAGMVPILEQKEKTAAGNPGGG
jgi:hypothetical protein